MELPERDFYIDRLRSVMIVLVVLHHTAITYGATGGWFYHDTDQIRCHRHPGVRHLLDIGRSAGPDARSPPDSLAVRFCIFAQGPKIFDWSVPDHFAARRNNVPRTGLLMAFRHRLRHRFWGAVPQAADGLDIAG